VEGSKKLACEPQRQPGPALSPLTGPLLVWYDGHARILPWREEPTPYRVWISEVMLQQTRVEAVKPYFDRFLSALPDVEALACAPEEILLKLWEGLGYYSRVRNLQRAARIILERDGGALPASVALLRSLPGVGEYTAGAIASIAFGLPVPAVDGNVLRVAARLTAFEGDVTEPANKRALTAAVAAILPKERPGDFNQALMELGATICLPNGAPRCGKCPLANRCEARKKGNALSLPVKKAKKPRHIEEKTVLVVRAGGDTEKILLEKRPAKGLLAGMWQFPMLEGIKNAQQVREELEKQGATVCEIRPLSGSKHIFTHVEWRMTAFFIRCARPFGQGRWTEPAEREQYALPSAFGAYEGFLRGEEENVQLAWPGGEEGIRS